MIIDISIGIGMAVIHIQIHLHLRSRLVCCVSNTTVSMRTRQWIGSAKFLKWQRISIEFRKFRLSKQYWPHSISISINWSLWWRQKFLYFISHNMNNLYPRQCLDCMYFIFDCFTLLWKPIQLPCNKVGNFIKRLNLSFAITKYVARNLSIEIKFENFRL